MGLTVTLIIMGIAAAIVVLARFMTNRPYEPGKARHIPWNIIMITAAAIAIFMLVHVFSLMGYDVGGGRRMP